MPWNNLPFRHNFNMWSIFLRGFLWISVCLLSIWAEWMYVHVSVCVCVRQRFCVYLHVFKLLLHTWFLWLHKIALGGSGKCLTIQVRLMVEPMSIYKSGPPRIVVTGSVSVLPKCMLLPQYTDWRMKGSSNDNNKHHHHHHCRHAKTIWRKKKKNEEKKRGKRWETKNERARGITKTERRKHPNHRVKNCFERIKTIETTTATHLTTAQQ